jgi:UDP-N-acetylmuramoyl-tripeptide--D-alanyl-D-alanine ligase
MGARGPGHIAELCAIARPTTSVVTRVAPAHLETFGTVDGVATAKSEIVRDLPPDGTAVLNADDERVAAMAAVTRARVVTYSAAGAEGADLVAAGVELDDELRPRFALRSPWGAADVRLGARGLHNVGNALAAAAAALAVGVPLDAVVAALATSTLSRWRMELVRGPGGLRILNDCYNANPASMEAALRALVRLPARRHVAVLGRMGELGDAAAEAHRAAGALARSLGVVTLAVGEPAYGGQVVADIAEAEQALGALGLGGDDALLVKASRAVGLEALTERLRGAASVA